MSELIHLEKQGDVAVLTIDNPPVNPISSDVCAGLAERFAEVAADDSVAAVVLTGAGRAFVAGADIREFGKPRDPNKPGLRDVAMQIEDMEKPVVAAINGACAGGGLELALGCHFRLASPGAQIGLPEVNLGLIPGAGGTQRLPRVIGAEAALDAILGGRLMPAPQAKAMGIVEDVIDGDIVAAAVDYARKAAADGVELPRASKRTDKIDESKKNMGLFDDRRKAIARRYRGFEAPFYAIDAVEAAVTLPFDEGMKKEREIADITVASTQSAAQRYLFFAEREALKIPDIPKDTPTKDIKKAAIVGAGTMGGGISMCFANVGIPVTIIDESQEALDRGLGRVRNNYEVSVKRGSMKAEDVDKRMGLLTGSTDIKDVADADIIIEAVFEEMNLKKEIFKKLDEHAKDGAILATNSSALDIDQIAAVTKRPEVVIGTHFFSPANVMRLLENVRASKSSPETIATVMKLGQTLRKQPVLAGLCPGYIGNRILRVYLREADELVFEGALPQQIDKVIYDFGFAMGPYAVRDMAGTDVGYQARKLAGTNERQYILNDRLCDEGRLGQKTGAGYYRYEEGSRTPIPDPYVENMIEEVSKELGITRRAISDEEILERIIYPMINEGAKIVDEGYALRASDIDVAYVHGYGFPRYRGGLMFYADTIGPDKVYEAMERFHKARGDIMEPSKLLEKLAKEGGKFTEQ